jgi:hypothetical protein
MRQHVDVGVSTTCRERRRSVIVEALQGRRAVNRTVAGNQMADTGSAIRIAWFWVTMIRTIARRIGGHIYMHS